MPHKRTREEVDSDTDEDEQSDEEGGIRIDDDIYIPPPPRRLSQLNENGARLIISQIIITNFKSYAGKVVLKPFNTSFSSIVGPNGSGKSNVIDAMLFVFGYRANRIRSTSIGVLVHNSPEHPNVTECKVSIYMEKIIDVPGGTQKVPDSLIKFSRRGYKNNSSRYELNDKTVPFKEIERRLKAEGIDLDHSRFLILQGEVEQIALMKPKAANENDTGMLEFLDGIIGTHRIKEPLEKISEKLQELSETLREREQRLRLVEEEREELRGPMQDAVKYLKTENTITQLKNSYFQVKKYETKEEMRESEESNREIEEQFAGLKEKMKEIKEELGEKSEEFAKKSKKWSDVQRRKDAIDQRYQELSKRDENLYAQLVEQNKHRKEKKAEVEKEKVKLEELQRVPEKNARDAEECKSFIEKQAGIHEREDREYKEMMEAVHKKTEPLDKKRKEFEEQKMELTGKLNEAREAFNLAETELKLYLSTAEKERELYEKLKAEFQTSTAKIEEHREKFEELERKIPETEESLRKTQEKLEGIKVQEAKLSAELNKMRAQHNEQNQAMRSNKSQSKVLVALMEEKNSGRIPGILGRLGDLGAIDAKYDVAVSTACGPLDNVVVENVDTAEACIEFLKRSNVGRTTFIALEKQQRLAAQMNQKISTPEDVPRLFDLIRVSEERVKPAFFFALRNTLVAEDLDQATRIAYGQQRHRVVTLKGELIEATGTMTGGGNRPYSGRMGRNLRAEFSAADLQKLQEKMDQVWNECNKLKAQQPALEDQVRDLTSELQEMLRSKVASSAEVKGLATVIPALKKKLESQKKKVKDAVVDPEKVQELTEVKERKQKEFEVFDRKAQKFQEEIDRINEKINEIAGNKIKEKRKIIKELVEGIEKAKKEITRLKVATTAAENNAAKTNRKIENLLKDIESCVQKISDGQKERAELEKEAKELQEKQTECEEALAERNQVLGELSGEIEKLKSQEAKLKSTKIDLDQKIAASRKLVAEFKGKIQGYEARIAELKLRRIPELPEETLEIFDDEALSNLDSRTVKANLDAAKERLPGEMPNMKSIDDFERVNERFFKRAKEAEEIANAKNLMRGHFDRITRMRHEEFQAGFDEICTSLKELYQMITQGGAAELEFADSLNPYADGIVFSVRPPKKSWKNISNLSGGEKTLSSLALVFALHNYKPTPLYFMDEIDAALDFKNVSIIANYIKDKTENAQFIVISLRSEMFELAETLVGIYKTHNSTKTVTVIKKNLYEQHPELEIMERERKERPGHKNPATQPVNGNFPVNANLFPLSCPPRISETGPEAVTRRLSPVLAENDGGESESSNLELDYELGLKERPQPFNLRADDSLGLEESSTSIDDHENSLPAPTRRSLRSKK